MGRRKHAENCAVPAWASGRIDSREKRFVMLGNSLFFDSSFQTLSAGAKHLYISMCLECGGRRVFTFPHGAAKKYGIPARSFDRYTAELLAAGFISMTSGKNTRTANVFSFEFGWKKRTIEPP